MGLVFEVPLVIIGLTQAGIATPGERRGGRRYALAGCALVAAFLPGDAVTMLLETAPFYLLFELGVLIAALIDRRGNSTAASAATAA